MSRLHWCYLHFLSLHPRPRKCSPKLKIFLFFSLCPHSFWASVSRQTCLPSTRSKDSLRGEGVFQDAEHRLLCIFAPPCRNTCRTISEARSLSSPYTWLFQTYLTSTARPRMYFSGQESFRSVLVHSTIELFSNHVLDENFFHMSEVSATWLRENFFFCFQCWRSWKFSSPFRYRPSGNFFPYIHSGKFSVALATRRFEPSSYPYVYSRATSKRYQILPQLSALCLCAPKSARTFSSRERSLFSSLAVSRSLVLCLRLPWTSAFQKSLVISAFEARTCLVNHTCRKNSRLSNRWRWGPVHPHWTHNIFNALDQLPCNLVTASRTRTAFKPNSHFLLLLFPLRHRFNFVITKENEDTLLGMCVYSPFFSKYIQYPVK